MAENEKETNDVKDFIEDENSTQPSFAEFVRNAEKIGFSAFARYGLYMLVVSVTTFVFNWATLQFFISELTDQIDYRLDVIDERVIENKVLLKDTSEKITQFSLDSSNVITRLETNSIKLEAALRDLDALEDRVGEIFSGLVRIEAQSLVSSEILTSVSNNEDSIQLEEMYPSLRQITEEYLPMGGPDTDIVAGMPVAHKTFPITIRSSELEQEKAKLTASFETALTGGLGPQMNRETQEVEVIHGVFYSGKDDQLVISVIAYVVNK